MKMHLLKRKKNLNNKNIVKVVHFLIFYINEIRNKQNKYIVIIPSTNFSLTSLTVRSANTFVSNPKSLNLQYRRDASASVPFLTFKLV